MRFVPRPEADRLFQLALTFKPKDPDFEHDLSLELYQAGKSAFIAGIFRLNRNYLLSGIASWELLG